MSYRLECLDEEIAELKANFATELAGLEAQRPQFIAAAIKEADEKVASATAAAAALRASFMPAEQEPVAFLLPLSELHVAAAPLPAQPVAAVEAIRPVAAKVRWDWATFVNALGLEGNHPVLFKPAGNFFKGKNISVPCSVTFEGYEPSIVSALYETEIKSLNPTALGSSIKAKMGAPASRSSSARGWPSCVGSKEFFINHAGVDYNLADKVWEGLLWDAPSKTFVAKAAAVAAPEPVAAADPKPKEKEKRKVPAGALAWCAFVKHVKATKPERFVGITKGSDMLTIAKTIKEGNMEEYQKFVTDFKAAHQQEADV